MHVTSRVAGDLEKERKKKLIHGVLESDAAEEAQGNRILGILLRR